MDKLLNAVKDFSAIKKYLAAINQTTDDYLFVIDIKSNRIQFFRSVDEFFNIKGSDEQVCTLEDVISIVHPADRKALSADIEGIRLGTKDAHDMNLRIFKLGGETVWVNSRGKVLHDENKAPYVMIGRLSEEALRHLFNPITGLWNRTKLREDLKSRLHNGKGWLMKLGIPAFADINLSHGKSFGNELLCEMADILEHIDFIEESYHVDNNNFAVITEECDRDTIEQMYAQICEAMNEKCSVFAGAVPIDNSIFIDVSQLINSANITLSDSVQSLNPSVAFFSAEEINRRISELTLLEELKESVQNDFEGFEVFYQPQIKSGSYELYGVEALLRYNSNKRGRVFPDEFIPILEQSGLIEPVGMWVLKRALAQCKEWRKSIPNLQVAVNFSSVQFDDQRLGERIVEALKEADMPGSALTVELTESLRLNQNQHYYDIIKYIKSYGVRFSIDDFGTGYSNLGYLKQLDVNEIKIDRSFVSEIEKNTYNYHLISNVIEFAKSNSIHACCEGVETAKELSVLEPLQADFFQGYLFDKPCTPEEITKKYIHSDSDKFKARMKALDEIYRFKQQFGSIHFDPQNILRENDIGLWIIRIDEKNTRHELHVDSVMERVLGLEEKLSPEECYEYWHSRILPGDTEYVDNAVSMMINDRKAVQLKYHWQHPSFGTVSVRSSGIRTQDENTMVVLEGYHRILTGVEGV
ncbi:MAG: EAL domain-containing protein [Clostridia bacterium]|nr:EAL domain-containing protein [Clostridia bacterium]